MTNSTPYELRFKVLEMARDLCMDQFYRQSETFYQLHQKIEHVLDQPAVFGVSTADTLRDMLDQLMDATPSVPAPEQINAKARELYEFVSTK